MSDRDSSIILHSLLFINTYNAPSIKDSIVSYPLLLSLLLIRKQVVIQMAIYPKCGGGKKSGSKKGGKKKGGKKPC